MTVVALDQKMSALALANEIRISNAQLKRDISVLSRDQGCEKVAQLLINPTGPVASMPVGRLLVAIHRIGEDGMARYLRNAGIFSATKRVGALTPRQRTALARVLRDRQLLWPCAA